MLNIIVSLIFAVISILLLFGKGSFLIAGYNTSSKEEKQKYDEKKLCRMMGLGFSVITIGLFVSVFLKKDGIIPMFICIVVGMLIILFGTRYCYSENAQQQDNLSWYKKKGLLSTIFGLVVLLLITMAMFIGDVHVIFENDYLKVSATMTKSMQVNYEDITSVDYRDDLDTGSRTFGIGNAVIGAGRFKNDEWGRYHLYAYVRCDDYIVIHTSSDIIVLNAKTKDETQKTYQKIQNKIKK